MYSYVGLDSLDIGCLFFDKIITKIIPPRINREPIVSKIKLNIFHPTESNRMPK